MMRKGKGIDLLDHVTRSSPPTTSKPREGDSFSSPLLNFKISKHPLLSFPLTLYSLSPPNF
jgi:hypothetical protein